MKKKTAIILAVLIGALTTAELLIKNLRPREEKP